jgi:hypothetical protein
VGGVYRRWTSPDNVGGFAALRAPEKKPGLVLLTLADTSGRDLGAGCLATFGGLALVDAAGEAIDEPHILVVRALHPNEPGADCRNQSREQYGRSDQP